MSASFGGLTPKIAASLAVLLAAARAEPALAQAGAANSPAAIGARPPGAAPAVSMSTGPARSTLRTRRRARQAWALNAMRAANSRARDTPTAGAYVNAALYYDFEPGRLYALNTCPRFLTAITLRPGEKLISKAAGDTVRWVLGETVEGSGATQQVLVMVKPLRGGLRTNIILTTDQRTYLLDAVSHEGDAYTSVIRWNYPQEEARAAEAPRPAAPAAAVPALAVGALHFGYRVQPVRSRPPRWQPLRVFDDGLKTYIQFPRDIDRTEAPPLFVIGAGRQAQLVNDRDLDGYYVVDRLFDVAELRLGERPQTVVRITRTGEGERP